MQEVVDRQDRPDSLEPRIVRHGRPKESGDERRMPVVRVDHIGPEIRGRDQVEDGLAEESEPLPVVIILVDLRTVVQVGLVDQVDRDFPDPGGSESGLMAGVPQSDRESRHLLLGTLDRPVSRHDDSHVVAKRCQGFRQTAGHIAEAAYFGERIRLGGCEQDLHRNLGVDMRPGLKPASGTSLPETNSGEKSSDRSVRSVREGFFPRRPCRGQCRPLRSVTSSSCFTPICRGSSATVDGRTAKPGSTRRRPSAISPSCDCWIASRRKGARDRSPLASRPSSPRCLPLPGSAPDSWPTWRSGGTARKRTVRSSKRRATKAVVAALRPGPISTGGRSPTSSTPMVRACSRRSRGCRIEVGSKSSCRPPRTDTCLSWAAMNRSTPRSPRALRATAGTSVDLPAASGCQSAPIARDTNGPAPLDRRRPGYVPASKRSWGGTGSGTSS